MRVLKKEKLAQKNENLTQVRLKEVLSYNAETGLFTRIGSKYGATIGRVVGIKHSKGYLYCCIDGKTHFCHRLAWLYVYGHMPKNGIKHINRVKTDNRIENLKGISNVCNARNTKQKHGTVSGVKGVYWDKQANKWHAQITINNKRYNLGNYNSKNNAVCARLATEQCLDWDMCDNNSPAYQYVQKMLSSKNSNLEVK